MDEDMPLGEFGSGIYHTIRTLAEELLDDVLKKDIGDPNTFERDCKSSILFFFCKAYKSYQAIYHLWYSGFDQDAGIINRTLFELLLQATWINHDSKTNAPLFQDHVQTHPYALYLSMTKLANANKLHNAVDMVKKIEIASQFDVWRDQYNRFKASVGGTVPQNWWGGSIHDLVRKLCEQGVDTKFFSEEYYYAYKTESGLVHSTALWKGDYLEVKADELQLHYYPEPPRNASVIVHASRRFLRVVSILNAVWDLNYAAEITEDIQVLEEMLEISDSHSI